MSITNFTTYDATKEKRITFSLSWKTQKGSLLFHLCAENIIAYNTSISQQNLVTGHRRLTAVLFEFKIDSLGEPLIIDKVQSVS